MYSQPVEDVPAVPADVPPVLLGNPPVAAPPVPTVPPLLPRPPVACAPPVAGDSVPPLALLPPVDGAPATVLVGTVEDAPPIVLPFPPVTLDVLPVPRFPPMLA